MIAGNPSDRCCELFCTTPTDESGLIECSKCARLHHECHNAEHSPSSELNKRMCSECRQSAKPGECPAAVQAEHDMALKIEREFNLNKEQSGAATSMTTQALKRLHHDNVEQLLLVVDGLRNTGKTRLTTAYTKFVKNLGKQNTLRCITDAGDPYESIMPAIAMTRPHSTLKQEWKGVTTLIVDR